MKVKFKSIWIVYCVWISSVGCFIGPDSYEHSINDYFHLYSNTYETDKVCIGTIDSIYRIGDGYGCFIKRVGWDEKFMVYENNRAEYFIQDLRNLAGKYPSEFKEYLFGPYNVEQFKSIRDSLKVDPNLKFKIAF